MYDVLYIKGRYLQITSHILDAHNTLVSFGHLMSNKCTDKITGTVLPATGTALPAAVTAPPAAGISQPAMETALPAIGTALPAIGTALPAI